MWAGGILIAVAAGLGGYVVGVGLEEGDRLASVIAAITGLAGLGVALYGLKRPPVGAAPEVVAAELAGAPRPTADPPQPMPAAGRSYGGDHVEIHGTFHGPVQGKGTQHTPPSA